MNKAEDEHYSEEETTRRAQAALKRALNTPPRPHKPLGNPKESRKAKPRTSDTT